MKKTKTFRKEAVVWLITTLLVLTAVVVFTPFAIITRAAPLPFSADFESASNWASKWAQDIVSDGAPSDPDTHFWQRVDSTYSATPTNLDPYSGNYMAIFDSGLLYPHGTQTRLFLTDSLDFTSSSSGNVYLSFYLYYSDWGSTEDDDLVVEVNVGSGWILVDTYDTYDPSDLGWVQETVDLSSYNTASEAYIGFLAVDDGYRDVCIDNVVVGESPPPPSCCLEIEDIGIDLTGSNCNAIEVEFSNNCNRVLNNVDLIMTFTVDPTHLCPCGGDPYLEPPLNPAGSGIWKRQWTSLSLGAFSTDTRNEQVKGWAYFTLVVTLYSPTAGPGNTPCEVTETRTGFTGIQLF